MDVDFEVLPVGENGDVVLEPISTENRLCSAKLPMGLPPVLPDMKSQLQAFLYSPENLPIFHLDEVQKFIPMKPNISSLYSVDVCPLQTQLVVKRDMTTGKLLGFAEEVIESNTGSHNTSMSLSRAPGPKDAGLRGSSSSFPFWPGGMDEPVAQLLQRDNPDFNIFDEELLYIPPGFETGMKFERKTYDQVLPQKINLSDVLSSDEHFHHILADSPESEEKVDLQETLSGDKQSKEENAPLDADEEFLKMVNLPVLEISTSKTQKPAATYEWAVIDDVNKPVKNFKEKIPVMAREFPYTLDPFQAQAILHLERKESVLVAAHTSAGKTTVADYAIALAHKHMTRVIYTSPIKALSNQKYANFKTIYGKDVGLITGDVQINPTAFCLVMTTEILRSMLYRGSDVIRELEWVIFDEVHYINDSERGVVWEEVFIMLPNHVNLIMLSATVPNAAQFADWIGGIKKRKIYVLSTAKRPVPLEHYLYTGCVGKTENEIFPIVDASGKFLLDGYEKAIRSKQAKDSKSKSTGPKTSGPKGGRYMIPPAQEKNIYIGLLNHLKKNSLLPAVCFTFSRKRCNSHAALLASQDFTTSETDAKMIDIKFQTWINTLNPKDRELPQVLMMKDHLKRGIAIHHSGILPILKEIIEKLFDQGFVKVLFATETFAMGVNMPTRTVVFDSVRKHDGTQFRDLNPSEYTQMAGRAGRRDKDKSGTVVVLCKLEVPEASVLSTMMRGKPTELRSQFKLTYNMILNLLKVRTFRVEDVMARSFGESDNQRKQRKYKDLLREKESERGLLNQLKCAVCEKDLPEYYAVLSRMRELKALVMAEKCKLAVSSKLLTTGRVLSISSHNIPALLLSIDRDKLQVLSVAPLPKDDPKSVSFSPKLHLPGSANSPYLVNITLSDVECIGNKVLKIDAAGVLRECKRQQAGGQVGMSTSSALLELLTLCEGGTLQPASIPIKDIAFADKICCLEASEATLGRLMCTKCPDFKTHFSEFYEHSKIEEAIKECKYKLSEESLELHPEFQNRKQVLKDLSFIDSNETVLLKGSVAREMSNHELIITELLIRSVFTDCPPEDVAALLSCMVFDSKADDSELQLPSNLLQKIEEIKEIAHDIDRVQKKCDVQDPNFVSQYNFHLAPVVYEWAKGTEFQDIMQCTEVDEGIIVRSIQRLCELLKDVRSGAKLVGDTTLADKMEAAADRIRRNIVFAQSLYTLDFQSRTLRLSWFSGPGLVNVSLKIPI